MADKIWVVERLQHCLLKGTPSEKHATLWRTIKYGLVSRTHKNPFNRYKTALQMRKREAAYSTLVGALKRIQREKETLEVLLDSAPYRLKDDLPRFTYRVRNTSTNQIIYP